MAIQNRRGRAGKRVGIAAAAVAAALTTLVGCAADASDVPGAATIAPTVNTTGVTVNVIALDNTFRAQDTKARVGDTVTFTNKGKNDHDVLPQEGGLWGVHIAGFHPGDTYSYVFAAPGVYPFFCSIHGTNLKGMVGTVTVTG